MNGKNSRKLFWVRWLKGGTVIVCCHGSGAEMGIMSGYSFLPSLQMSILTAIRWPILYLLMWMILY